VVVANTAAAAAGGIATDFQVCTERSPGCRASPFYFGSVLFAGLWDGMPGLSTGQVKEIMKEEHIEIEGRIHTVLPGTMFRVELNNKHLVLATICGKMRKRWVRLTAGDRVKLEMSPYDLNKARIVWRLG
jgi:translation initiation factor IF-1